MMKILFAILFASFLIVRCEKKSSSPFRAEIVDLFSYEGIYQIDGGVVGAAGEPGGFYLLSQKVAKEGKEEAFRSMLNDPNPAVRVMGLVCLAKNEKEVPILKGDDLLVTALPFGCIAENITVEEFSKRLKSEEEFRIGFTWKGEES